MKRKSVIFLVMAILSTVFIFSNSCRTAAVSSQQSGRIVDFLLHFIKTDAASLTNIIRKLAHFIEFFNQALWISLFIISVKSFPRNIIYVFFCGLLSACCDEFLQLFFDGRGSMVSDVFIDFSGTCIGAVFVLLIYISLRKKRQTEK